MVEESNARAHRWHVYFYGLHRALSPHATEMEVDAIQVGRCSRLRGLSIGSTPPSFSLRIPRTWACLGLSLLNGGRSLVIGLPDHRSSTGAGLRLAHRHGSTARSTCGDAHPLYAIGISSALYPCGGAQRDRQVWGLKRLTMTETKADGGGVCITLGTVGAFLSDSRGSSCFIVAAHRLAVV
eukprot:scaffold92046_cov36-Tisochrysis_lutea.AAC.1